MPAALILASESPRRRELLRRAGIAFEVRPAAIDERERPGESPEQMAARLARAKAETVAARERARPRWVLGADTVVVLDGCSLGKPRDAADALALLRRLVGREHRVLTAVALVSSADLRVRETIVESRVRMRPAREEELRAYVATGESLDKAGAYAVQGEGGRFVERVEGSETNVIGLPLDETLALLREAGVAR